MDTRSRSDWSRNAAGSQGVRQSYGPLALSLLSIGIALISIGYCFPHILELVGDGWERSTRAIAYFSRIIKGGIA